MFDMRAATPFQSTPASPPSYKAARTAALCVTAGTPARVIYTKAMVDMDGKPNSLPTSTATTRGSSRCRVPASNYQVRTRPVST